jgi:hypothetical protein
MENVMMNMDVERDPAFARDVEVIKEKTDKPVDKIATSAKLPGLSEKLTAFSAKLPELSEKLTGLPEKLLAFSEKLPGLPEKLLAFSEKLPGLPEKLLAFSEKLLGLPAKLLAFSEKLPGLPAKLLAFSEKLPGLPAKFLEPSCIHKRFARYADEPCKRESIRPKSYFQTHKYICYGKISFSEIVCGSNFRSAGDVVCIAGEQRSGRSPGGQHRRVCRFARQSHCPEQHSGKIKSRPQGSYCRVGRRDGGVEQTDSPCQKDRENGHTESPVERIWDQRQTVTRRHPDDADVPGGAPPRPVILIRGVIIA